MTENLPDSFDPQQPDVPTAAVDPHPETSGDSGTSSAVPQDDDPDADPQNLNPRDTRGAEQTEGDPDADPGMMNPRSS